MQSRRKKRDLVYHVNAETTGEDDVISFIAVEAKAETSKAGRSCIPEEF